VDTSPVDGMAHKRYKWQKAHVPNLTGTEGRYLPKGHIQRSAKREKNTSDYVAWKPE
jgi:NADH:ubiquinone oxidoreductase subunit